MTALRVIQWATGAVGRHAAAAIADHPDLELVGALVYSEDKAGRDVGEICGIDPLGVTATRDKDEILALDADCVVHMAQGEMDPAGTLDDICRLLACGQERRVDRGDRAHLPEERGPEVVDRLEAACREGGTSFHGTGIEPGWAAEVLPLTMSGLFRRIDSILVQELLDYSTYDSRDMLVRHHGLRAGPDAPVPMADPRPRGADVPAPLMLVADGLGATIDDFTLPPRGSRRR